MHPNDSSLQEGELYVVQNGVLRHLERSPDDLPKVPLSRDAHADLLALRKRCRQALGGFRPDIALVASALIEHGAHRADAPAVVAAYFQALAAASASSLGRPAASVVTTP